MIDRKRTNQRWCTKHYYPCLKLSSSCFFFTRHVDLYICFKFVCFFWVIIVKHLCRRGGKDGGKGKRTHSEQERKVLAGSQRSLMPTVHRPWWFQSGKSKMAFRSKIWLTESEWTSKKCKCVGRLRLYTWLRIFELMWMCLRDSSHVYRFISIR